MKKFNALTYIYVNQFQTCINNDTQLTVDRWELKNHFFKYEHICR